MYRTALFNTGGQAQHVNNKSSALIRLKTENSETEQADCRLITGTVCNMVPETSLNFLFVTSKVTIKQ
jgi:hypothetical protein